MTRTVFAIVLAGGGGTRLWPASRRKRPKQLLDLGGGESLLAGTVRRAAALAGRERTLVVTARDQEESTRAALSELPPENILAEPEPRNTAAAAGLGAAVAARRGGPQALCAVMPADHHISDEAGFLTAARTALQHAGDAIVTIGIRPSHPETGFGYIQLGAPVAAGEPPVHEVAAFVEKPDRPTAERYVSSGRYLWNAGYFFFSSGRFVEEAHRHMPELGAALDQFIAADDLSAVVAGRYGALPAISIDYGIMEKASGLRVVAAEFGWSDVGSWAALSTIRPPDSNGNVLLGDVIAEQSGGSVVLSEPGAPLVGVVGARDLVIIATPDAVLVVPRERAQDVRRIVDALKAQGRNELL